MSISEQTLRRTRRAVDPALARSWLLVPGSRPDLFADPSAVHADQLILDLEDGVSPGGRSSARAEVATWLRRGGSAWVRINAHGTADWSEDLDVLSTLPTPPGVMLAKTEHPAHVGQTRERLGGGQVIALLESAVGIEAATSIAAAPGVFRLAFGSGDYRRDTGTGADDLAMAYPRTKLVVASRIAGLPGPIDGPLLAASPSALLESTGRSVAMGMTGRLCLEPAQAPVINEGIGPRESEVRWARDFLAEHRARGGAVRDGSDLPRLRRAERILQLAEAFGGDRLA